MSSIIGRLSAAHHIITREIGRERRRPRPDDLRLARLKKERLAIKDRLFRHLRKRDRVMAVVRDLLGQLRARRA